MSVKLKPGWLFRQLNIVKENVERWPKYMKRTAGVEMKNLYDMTLRELVDMLEPIGDGPYTERSKAWGELDSRLDEIEAAVVGMEALIRERQIMKLFEEGHLNGVDYRLAHDEAEAALDAYRAVRGARTKDAELPRYKPRIIFTDRELDRMADANHD